MRVMKRICTLMWCPGYSGISLAFLDYLKKGLWFWWSYNVALRGECNHSPWLHHDMATCPIDAVSRVVVDYSTTIGHLVQKENLSLFQGLMQSWPIQSPDCKLLEVESAKSCSSWSRLGFVMKFIGQLKLIEYYPCLHTNRRQHGCPARPLATNHRDFP